MEPGNKGQYFLRRLWKDPLVKGGQWQFLYASPAGVSSIPRPRHCRAPGLRRDYRRRPEGLRKSFSHRAVSGNQPGASPFEQAGRRRVVTGMPIAGVKSRCTEQPFRVFKSKTSYSEWTFSIFDLDPRVPVPAPAVNQPESGGLPTNRDTSPFQHKSSLVPIASSHTRPDILRSP